MRPVTACKVPTLCIACSHQSSLHVVCISYQLLFDQQEMNQNEEPAKIVEFNYITYKYKLCVN